MQIVFCVDAVTCTVVYSIHEPRKKLFFDCQMKKTRERQAGRTETLTQRQMNTKRKTNINAYEQQGEDGYKNVKIKGTKEKKKD